MCLHAAYLKVNGRFSANSLLKAYGFKGLECMTYCDIMSLSDHSWNRDPEGQYQNTIQWWIQCFLLSSITPTTQAAMWINATRDVISYYLPPGYPGGIVAKWLAQGQIRIVAWHWTFKSDSHLAVKSQGDFVLRFPSAFPDLQNTIRDAEQNMCLP